MTRQEDLKSAVNQHYAARARQATAMQATDALPIASLPGEIIDCDDSCCVPGGLTSDQHALVKALYAEDDVAGLPPGALDAAAGCGNPTAISELQPGETVLDLGSGGGIDCFLAARQVGPQGHVIGVDMTVEMVELARRSAAELGIDNVQFKLGEIEDIPLADASVDVVISNCVINLSVDKAAVFAEAARVLKPGGRLRLSDIVWTTRRAPDAVTAEGWARCIEGALEVPEFLDGLVQAGFGDSRIEKLAFLDEARGLASALISAEKRPA